MIHSLHTLHLVVVEVVEATAALEVFATLSRVAIVNVVRHVDSLTVTTLAAVTLVLRMLLLLDLKKPVARSLLETVFGEHLVAMLTMVALMVTRPLMVAMRDINPFHLDLEEFATPFKTARAIVAPAAVSPMKAEVMAVPRKMAASHRLPVVVVEEVFASLFKRATAHGLIAVSHTNKFPRFSFFLT